MSDFDQDRNPVEVLADEFAARYRNGEHPSIGEYTSRYPDYAAEIEDLFPSVVMMEQLKRRENSNRESLEKQGKIGGRRIERIGDYEIVREVGRGGMGVVFEAIQTSLGRRVAVKVLNDSAMASGKQVKRFEREARAAAALHHTNIVPVFGVGQEDGLHFYVMQFIAGVGLDEILAALRTISDERSAAEHSDPPASGPHASSALKLARALQDGSFAGPPTLASSGELRSETQIQAREDLTVAFEPSQPVTGSSSETQFVAEASGALAEAADLADPSFGSEYWRSLARLGLQVADALQYAHGQGVLHRDIKPGNLLLDAQGTVWVADFGLAKLLENQELTKSGDIVGTLRYMAPEQLDGRFDARGDIYSLGLTLYELLTLRPACNETEIKQLLKRQANDDVVRPRAINPDIPRDLETIILKAISADPSHRYQTAQDLASDLQCFLDDQPIQARRITPLERLWRWARRNPAMAALGSTAAVLLLLVATVSTWGYVHVERERQRAEHNLTTAMDAFDQIIANLRARGAAQAFDLVTLPIVDLQENGDEAAAAGGGPEEEAIAVATMVTPADARLLDELLVFFDKFARENSANLAAETAKAYRSMGDIQQRLGNDEAATAAYQSALERYEQLTAAEAGAEELVLARADILNQLAHLARRQRNYEEYLELCREARDWLLDQPEGIAASPGVRFALVQTYLNFFPSGPATGFSPTRGNRDQERGRSRGSRRGRGRGRGRGGFFSEEMRVELEQALDQIGVLVQSLLDDDANNPEYRLARAKEYRVRARQAAIQRQTAAATEACDQWDSILRELVEDFPNQTRYRFELAGALVESAEILNQIRGEPGTTKLQEARRRLEELVMEFPSIPEYQLVLGRCLHSLARAYDRANDLTYAKELYLSTIQRLQAVAERFPIVIGDLARARRSQARLFQETGDAETARVILEEAIAELETLTDKTGWGSTGRVEYERTQLLHDLGRSLLEASTGPTGDMPSPTL